MPQLIDIGPRARAALEQLKTTVVESSREAEKPQPREPQPPDTKPIVLAPLHNIKVVRGTKVASPAAFVKRPLRQRIKTLSTDLRAFMSRAWSFVVAVTSRRMTSAEANSRGATCMVCPRRVVTLKVRRSVVKEQSYCDACGCPHWYGSRLAVKNRMSKWYCPLRRHDGPYPDDAIREHIVAAGYATVEQLDASGGSCRGCGG